jgi:hypothetical protein
MTDRDALLEMVRAADPDPRPIAWSASPQADALLGRILSSGGTAPSVLRPNRSSRRARRMVVLVATLLVAGGIGAAADGLFGSPAPEAVRRDLSGVDQGMPEDLRLNPDVERAQLAASAADADLYYATLSDGGYCFEIVTDAEGARGAVCTPAATARANDIEITIPFTDPITVHSPIVVGGRVNVEATSLEAGFADGTTEPIALGADGFYLYDVPRAELASAHLDGFSLTALDPTGASVASATAPPSDLGDPLKADRQMPIFVSTISTHEDFTKVLGVEGSVNVEGATRLELRYPDGSTARIPLRADGSYSFDLPPSRVDDLASEFGTLTAYDAQGHELASAPVASVAAWHAAG